MGEGADLCEREGERVDTDLCEREGERVDTDLIWRVAIKFFKKKPLRLNFQVNLMPGQI